MKSLNQKRRRSSGLVGEAVRVHRYSAGHHQDERNNAISFQKKKKKKKKQAFLHIYA
jgi:hypothetical protein